MTLVLRKNQNDSAETVNQTQNQQALQSTIHILIVGSGPVGVRFAKELLTRLPHASVKMFGNEPYLPYNRVQLSSLLAGEINFDDILTELPDPKTHPNFGHQISTIRSIDSEAKTLTDNLGNQYPYDKLVIATGARPHRPNIPGIETPGVFTFRNLQDAETLQARRYRCRQLVVIGGGLLGVEAARSLCGNNTEVTLIQQGSRLMNRQLDDTAAQLLQNKIEALGIRVITNAGVRKIQGESQVSAVQIRTGEIIPCDTVVICAGINPNMELARQSRIKVGRGIQVDDQLQTSASDIFAIGECAEHQGITYGLVNPGFEQAAVVANVIANQQSHYPGSLTVSRLKVIGEAVCSMGEIAELTPRPHQKTLTYENQTQGIYRKLVIHRNRIIGAVGIGDWSEVRRLQDAFQQQKTLWPWQQLLFRQTGNLWSEAGKDNISQWPSTAIVCQCNSINQGQLVKAIASGCDNFTKLSEKTTAATVCGSCKPLLEQLLGNSGPRTKEKAWLATMTVSIAAILVALAIALLPPLTVADSVQNQGLLEKFWNDGYWKQVTGFTLLGLSLVGLLMALRKRLPKKKWGHFAYWRTFHVCLGLACISLLCLHTGFNLGANLNLYLMMDFLAVIFMGAVAGLMVALNHKFSVHQGLKMRKLWTWLHILVTWPLPVLVGLHILTVYYF